MEQSSASEKTVRTIRLDDEKLKKLLDQLDAAAPVAGKGRSSMRYSYRMKGVLVHMQQPGSTITVPYLVPTQNLGEGGMAFLHGGFVHPGTRCVAQLITTYGTWDDIPGAVVCCNYAEGNIHEVSVKFDRDIDPSVYCLAAMHTRVLLVEDDPSMARLAQFQLESLNAEVDVAENGKIAVEKAMSNAYDVLLMDIELPELNGLDATKQLRERGYSGLIIATTGLTRPEDAEKCIEAGCNKYIAKPIAKDTLSEILSSLRQEPLVSTLYNDPNMVEMIDAYVAELPKKTRALETAFAKKDAQRVEALSRSLKSEGSSFGFGPISDAAAKIESLLQGGGDIAGVQEHLSALVSLCMQAQSSCKRTHSPTEPTGAAAAQPAAADATASPATTPPAA